MQYRLFFSHGGEDAYIVENFLKPKFEKSGAYVFFDHGELQYGDDFRKIILSELKICDELVVFFTRSSLKRPWVLAEVGAMLIRNKRIVPITYGPDEEELQKVGILSLLGNNSIIKIEEVDNYVDQLRCRVEAHKNG